MFSAVNTGFSGGNNLAARFARGRFLLFLNDDSLVEPGFIDRLLRVVQGDPSIAAAGGKILSADGTLQEAGSVLWSDGWAAHVGAGLPCGVAGLRKSARRWTTSRRTDCLVDRAGLGQKVGGFRRALLPRLLRGCRSVPGAVGAGLPRVYEPDAQLRHLESQSTSAPFRSFLL